MENQLHPELAFQAGIPQENKIYDVHPALQAEVMPEPEQVQETVETVEAQPEQQPPQPEPESPKDRDWRAVRQRAEEAKALEREKIALERERDFYRQQAERNAQASQQTEDYRTDTERQLQQQIEDLRRVSEKNARDAQAALQKATIFKEEQRLLENYPDIKKVVSDENVKRLETEYPHLYRAVVSSNNVYDVGAAAYDMIKSLKIYKEAPTPLQSISQSQRNTGKPRSASTIAAQSGDTPIQKAGTMMGNTISSEEERKALYAEMVAASRNKVF